MHREVCIQRKSENRGAEFKWMRIWVRFYIKWVIYAG